MIGSSAKTVYQHKHKNSSKFIVSYNSSLTFKSDYGKIIEVFMDRKQSNQLDIQ